MSLKKERNRAAAVVLGGSTAAALAVIRDLAKHGISVYAVESDRKQVYIYSKYCKKCICPSARDYERDYIDFLVDLGKQFENKAVLIPTGDIETSAILKYKDELSSYYQFISSDFEIADLFLNKEKFYQLLEKYAISHPKTFFVTDEQSVEKIRRHLRFPCILKPVFSAQFSQDFHTKIFIVHSFNEFRTKLKKARRYHHKILVQEIIPHESGNVIVCDALYDHFSHLTSMFMYQRIRSYPYMFGTSCFVKPAFVPELEEVISSLVSKIGYFGYIDAEFIKDTRDDQYKLIEVNPRAWMQMGYSTSFGINFSYLGYQFCCSEKFNPPDYLTHVKKNEVIHWLYFFYDLRASLELMRKKKLSFREWIESYRCEKQFALFSWDDPLPIVVIIGLSFFKLLCSPLKYIIQK